MLPLPHPCLYTSSRYLKEGMRSPSSLPVMSLFPVIPDLRTPVPLPPLLPASFRQQTFPESLLPDKSRQY